MRKNSIKNTRINGKSKRTQHHHPQRDQGPARIHPMTSVTAVEVAPDLKTCKAYISVLGEKQAKDSTLRGLKNAEGYIRIGKAENWPRRLNLRNTPEIRFVLDESIEYGLRCILAAADMSRLPDVPWKDRRGN